MGGGKFLLKDVGNGGGNFPFNDIGGGGGMGGARMGGRGMGGGAGMGGFHGEDSDEDIFAQFGGGGMGGRMGGMGGRMGGMGGMGGQRMPTETKHTINVTLEDLFKQKKKKIKMTTPSGEKKVFEFDLQGKLKTGSKIRYTNAMGSGQDLVFEISLANHPSFEKKNVDLEF